MRSTLMRGAFRAKRQNSMSAANASAPSHSFQDEARANEPSMEEILASIRRIIADDDGLPGLRGDDRRRIRPDVDAPSLAGKAYPAPVLDRREDEPPSSLAFDPRREKLETGDARLLCFAARESEQKMEGAPAEIDDKSAVEQQYSSIGIPDAGPEKSLLSAEAAAAVASQFQALAASVALSESEILNHGVQEMLRPMLQQWLDANLPSLVERLVRVEIERLARSGTKKAI